ncbi:hypothetical protein AMJ40_05435 [candidate division TA06 bacterium DG_26]|uniref:Uncharacterized protein n=1 Tax=candidate division TA06 bacterium DG_26 TaxID=1703771 RepID=A0A0S7WIM7_UNCT6|nr:MAG: hypothetical protein AMJ40_05435 [candidate division TA06 bacterium DG_26]
MTPLDLGLETIYCKKLKGTEGHRTFHSVSLSVKPGLKIQWWKILRAVKTQGVRTNRWVGMDYVIGTFLDMMMC